MPGQAIITIGDKQWLCHVATTLPELYSGLSGVPELSPGTGVFFDLGIEQSAIDIYTAEMLFALDIIFVSGNFTVVEVLRDVQPGSEAYYLGETGARYFIEVNAGEGAGINNGDSVFVELVGNAPQGSSYMESMVGFAGFVVMGAFIAGMAGNVIEDMFSEDDKKMLVPSTATENGDKGLLLSFGGAGNGLVRWQVPVSGKTIVVEVTGIEDLSPRQLEDAFAHSTARTSNLVFQREFPLAAVDKHRVWWLATIDDVPVEVEVSGIRDLTERQLEDALANSVAEIKITSPGPRKPHRNDVTVQSWVERDRLGIWITERRTGKVIAEWWNEGAREMFEDGWFRPGVVRQQTITGHAFEKSVLDYAEHLELVSGTSSIDFMPDSPEFLAYTIDDIGYRQQVDAVFLQAIKRSRETT